jgi:hypothetical protein
MLDGGERRAGIYISVPHRSAPQNAKMVQNGASLAPFCTIETSRDFDRVKCIFLALFKVFQAFSLSLMHDQNRILCMIYEQPK